MERIVILSIKTDIYIYICVCDLFYIKLNYMFYRDHYTNKKSS